MIWVNDPILKTTLGTKRGDNYTSMLYRIKLYGDNGDNEWTESLIYKCLPDNKQARNTYKSEMLFNNEVTFYMKSFTALMEYQVSKVYYNSYFHHEVFKVIIKL